MTFWNQKKTLFPPMIGGYLVVLLCITACGEEGRSSRAHYSIPIVGTKKRELTNQGSYMATKNVLQYNQSGSQLENGRIVPQKIELESLEFIPGEDEHCLSCTLICDQSPTEGSVYAFPKDTQITLSYKGKEIITRKTTIEEPMRCESNPGGTSTFRFKGNFYFKKAELPNKNDQEGNLLIVLLEENRAKNEESPQKMWSKVNRNLLDIMVEAKYGRNAFSPREKEGYIASLLKLKEQHDDLDGFPYTGILHLFYLVRSSIKLTVAMPDGKKLEDTSPTKFVWW